MTNGYECMELTGYCFISTTQFDLSLENLLDSWKRIEGGLEVLRLIE